MSLTRLWNYLHVESFSNIYNLSSFNSYVFSLFSFSFHVRISYFLLTPYRSSYHRSSIKQGVFKNFAKSTGKHLCQSLFSNEVAGLRSATVLKKRLWHRCFPVNLRNFVENLFSQNLRISAPVHKESTQKRTSHL